MIKYSLFVVTVIINTIKAEEDKIKEAEKKVARLVDESIIALKKGDKLEALDKAKLAGKKERSVSKQREAMGLAESQNMDLTQSGNLIKKIKPDSYETNI